MKIRLANPNLQLDSIVDGEGIRCVLWTQGCIHNCKGCHNPQTHSFDDGFELDIEEVKEEIDALEGQDGITFSGGDPLHSANRMDVRTLMAEIKEKYPNKTIWLYTGDVWENVMHYPMMRYVDVLVDGEFMIEKRDIKLMWKGSSNQRVIDVQKSLRQTDPSIPILYCGDYN